MYLHTLIILKVFIASIGSNLMSERMKIARILWNANISAEYSHLDNPKFKKQLDDVLERGIAFMIVFGTDELDKNVVKIKKMTTHTEVEVSREEIVNYLIEQQVTLLSTGLDATFLDSMRNTQLAVGTTE